MKQLILASQSPRRKELLRQIGIRFITHPSDIDEKMPHNTISEEYVKVLSSRKALYVKEQLSSNEKNSFVILAADTIVVLDEMILGKPIGESDAYNMLRMLSDKWHEVMTGVTLIDVQTKNKLTHVEKTRVKIRHLTSNMIKHYIETGESSDKAGAYGIQGAGALLVEKIEGCYYNVVGLPLYSVSVMLLQMGIKTLLD